MSLNLIIFSKNRPLQLEFLLSTLQKHCHDYESVHKRILYKTTTNRYQHAYQKLIQKHLDIEFYEERDFRKQLWTLLEFDYTAFMVDDNVCLRDFSFCMCIDELKKNPDATGFSLRLGQDFVDFEDEKHNKVHWPSKSGEYWNYPMEVSSSIYGTTLIRNMFMQDTSNFIQNPNKLESFLHGKRDNSLPYIVYPEKSICICFPLNTVQDGSNAMYTGPGYDLESLLDRFEKDQWLRLPPIPAIHNGHYIPTVDEMKSYPM